MDKFDTRINQMKADIDEINKEIEQLKKVINILNNKIQENKKKRRSLSNTMLNLKKYSKKESKDIYSTINNKTSNNVINNKTKNYFYPKKYFTNIQTPKINNQEQNKENFNYNYNYDNTCNIQEKKQTRKKYEEIYNDENDKRNKNEETESSDDKSYCNKYNKDVHRYNDSTLFCNDNRFIKIKGGEENLFQRKNKPISFYENNCYKKHKNIKNITNREISSFMDVNRTVPKNMKSYVASNKPIRLNYNNDLQNDIIERKSHKKNINTSYNEKINNLKQSISFKGDNEEFIEYLRIIKIKSDITKLILGMFQMDPYLNDEEIKICFNKIDKLSNNKIKKETGQIYQYLVEELIKVNNRKQ